MIVDVCIDLPKHQARSCQIFCFRDQSLAFMVNVVIENQSIALPRCVDM